MPGGEIGKVDWNLLSQTDNGALSSFDYVAHPSAVPRPILPIEQKYCQCGGIADRYDRACRPVLHVENNVLALSKRLLPLIDALGYNMWWEVDRFCSQDNYFGSPQMSALELHELGEATTFSPNLLCLPKEATLDDYPAEAAASVARLVPVDVAVPDLGVYGIRIREPLHPKLAVSLAEMAETGERFAVLHVNRPVDNTRWHLPMS